MEIIKKKYCLIATYRLSIDSFLREIPLKDIALDDEGLVKLFESNYYKLLAGIDQDKKFDSFIYKSDQEGETIHGLNTETFNKKAQKTIRNSLNRLQVSFLGVRTQSKHTAKIKHNQNLIINILDYETGVKAHSISFEAISTSYGSACIPYKPVSPQQICSVLSVNKDNIDEYIDRFVSLENLSNDPVLHLITLFSLYEYICEGNKPFEALFSIEIAGKFKEVKRKNIPPELVKLTFIDKFKAARDFIAHGVLHGKPTLDLLKQFLESSSGEETLTFDRYNLSHINLINEVVVESQNIIKQYLRKELGIY